jgi:hypothetical protein
MSTSEAGHVYQAISAVTATMAKEGLAKSRANAQQGYKFRGIDDLYNAISGHLAANQLCMLPRVMTRDVVERQTKTGGLLIYTTLLVEFDFVSSKDGTRHTICTVGEAMDSGDKSANKAMSAAMKYACLVAFQIPTEGDNDADGTTHEVTAAKKRINPASVVAAQSDDVDKAVAGYIEQVEGAGDLKALMAIYATAQTDSALPASAKNYVQACLTAKRKQIEGKAA